MSVSARRSVAAEMPTIRKGRASRLGQVTKSILTAKVELDADASAATSAKLSVFVAADNRLLREALARMLMKKGNIEVTGLDSAIPLQAEFVAQTNAKVLLLTSRGALDDDLQIIQQVRACAPDVRIVLLGSVRTDAEFLQCVRAGIRGYLLQDASSDEVVEAIAAVHAGEAVCPGTLCTALFGYFESETQFLPCASPRRRLGLTRREQQLVPLIAKGLTNKEIANHFSLSEQTVKNHLYRMKQKTSAEDRLDIVELYRSHGFLI